VSNGCEPTAEIMQSEMSLRPSVADPQQRRLQLDQPEITAIFPLLDWWRGKEKIKAVVLNDA
jgi:hypothetical protein